MKLKLLVEEYAVCRLNNDSKIPTWIDTEKFYSITRTDDELSVIEIWQSKPYTLRSAGLNEGQTAATAVVQSSC